MWLQTLSLVANLIIFILTPISPDLTKIQKGLIGGFTGCASVGSLVWLTKSPNNKIKRLEQELKISRAGLEDTEARLTIAQINLSDSENEVKQLLDKIDELQTNYKNQLDNEYQKYSLALDLKTKDFEQKLTAKSSQIEKFWRNKLSEIVGKYEKQINKLVEELGIWQGKETYLKQLIEENEQSRKLLEIDRHKLDLEASQVQLSVERQVFSHQEALNNTIRENEDLRAFIEGYKAEIVQLNQMIVLLQNEVKAPKNPDVRLILELFAKKNVRLEYLETSEDFGIISHVFKPLSEYTEEAIKSICGQLPGFIETLTKPPSYYIGKGKIEIKIDTRKPSEKLKKIDKDWLVKVANSNSNLLILGARGTGKSELANNYSALLHKSVPNLQYKFIQPKPDDYSVFQIGDKLIKPDYLGFSSVDSVPSAYDGLIALNAEIHHRLNENQKAINRGLKCPIWEPIYWIIDEFQQLILQAESFGQTAVKVSLMIKNAVSLGRSLGVYVLAIGQIPNVAQFPKWNKADFDQFCTIFLKDAIAVGVTYSKTKAEENELTSQFELYRSSNIKYYGLVRENGCDGFITELPNARIYFEDATPYHTSSQALKPLSDMACDESTTITSHPITPSSHPLLECPKCGSFESVKNGKNRRKCKKCSKTFLI